MVAGGNRNALNREVGTDGRRDWSHGLFDCTAECAVCMSIGLVERSCMLANPLFLAGCWAMWCPCVVYSKNKRRLLYLQNRGIPLPGGGQRFNDDCCIYGCLLIPGYAWVLQVC
ncbi:hypothetical protein EDB89DRAFT_2014178 [Lactarius sanguifluus]|nr:hypothetical protein EDB89DRAFT_2014178 [Lactarius sanguifluus]